MGEMNISFEACTDELLRQAMEKRAFRLPGGVSALPEGIWKFLTTTGRSAQKAVDPTTAVERLFHPIEGMKAGWRAAAGRHHATQTLEKLRDLARQQRQFAKGSDQWKALAQERENIVKGIREPGFLSKNLGTGQHLYRHTGREIPLTEIMRGKFTGDRAKTLAREFAEKGRLQMGAEELSRRGWTGASRVGKYLPVGTKGLTVGFGATAVPGIINAPSPSPTGEGSTLERGLGELGSGAGIIMGSGIGLVPGIAAWYGAHKGGAVLGRILDRLRAGGSIGQAISAPSPEEAQSQLETIQRHYG